LASIREMLDKLGESLEVRETESPKDGKSEK